MQSNRSEESFHGHHDGEGPQKEDCCSSCCCSSRRRSCWRSACAARAAKTEKPAKTGTQGATNEARIAFLESYGWQVEPEPVKTQQVTVPADPSEVFLRYNELQISQGYDLLQYSGKELTRYVYRITNYPDESGVYYATLLVKDGQVVGADVASSAKNRRNARAEDAGVRMHLSK